MDFVNETSPAAGHRNHGPLRSAVAASPPRIARAAASASTASDLPSVSPRSGGRSVLPSPPCPTLSPAPGTPGCPSKRRGRRWLATARNLDNQAPMGNQAMLPGRVQHSTAKRTIARSFRTRPSGSDPPRLSGPVGLADLASLNLSRPGPR